MNDGSKSVINVRPLFQKKILSNYIGKTDQKCQKRVEKKNMLLASSAGNMTEQVVIIFNFASDLQRG